MHLVREIKFLIASRCAVKLRRKKKLKFLLRSAKIHAFYTNAYVNLHLKVTGLHGDIVFSVRYDLMLSKHLTFET